jgi:hypothetical protein
MKCPHCSTTVKLQVDLALGGGSRLFANQEEPKYKLAWNRCPECQNLIIIIRIGTVGKELIDHILYPQYYIRHVAPEVPDNYKVDFKEACAVLPPSPKASAAMSRRLLQNILHNEFQINTGNLSQEIKQFGELTEVPSSLKETVDAIRHFGNFAVHPNENVLTNTIIDVEPGEAEWLLEVIEELFDFTFVKPNKRAKMLEQLAEKRAQSK